MPHNASITTLTISDLAEIAREVEAEKRAIFGPETGDTWVVTDYAALFDDLLNRRERRQSGYSRREPTPF